MARAIRSRHSRSVRFIGQFGGFSLSGTGIASHPDCLSCRPPLDGSGTLGRRPCLGGSLQLGLLRLCGCAQAVGKAGVLGPIHLNSYARGEAALAQTVDGFRSTLATPYSMAWTRPSLKSSHAYQGGSLRRSSVGLSDEVTTSVGRCRLRSAEFPVALLLQSQNRKTERRLKPLRYPSRRSLSGLPTETRSGGRHGPTRST